jgi:hypothetical protein
MSDLFNIDFFIAASAALFISDFLISCFTEEDKLKKKIEKYLRDSLSLPQMESLISSYNLNLSNRLDYVTHRLSKKYTTLIFCPQAGEESREISKKVYIVSFSDLKNALKNNTVL